MKIHSHSTRVNSYAMRRGMISINPLLGAAIGGVAAVTASAVYWRKRITLQTRRNLQSHGITLATYETFYQSAAWVMRSQDPITHRSLWIAMQRQEISNALADHKQSVRQLRAVERSCEKMIARCSRASWELLPQLTADFAFALSELELESKKMPAQHLAQLERRKIELRTANGKLREDIRRIQERYKDRYDALAAVHFAPVYLLVLEAVALMDALRKVKDNPGPLNIVPL